MADKENVHVNMWHTQDNHSTNVTPSNQTSEILQEKMRELREKLEKLKSKGKSGTDGVDSGAAPSSPATAEVKQDKAIQPGRGIKCLHCAGNICYPQELKITVRADSKPARHASPGVSSSTHTPKALSPLTPVTPSAPVLNNTPPGASTLGSGTTAYVVPTCCAVSGAASDC